MTTLAARRAPVRSVRPRVIAPAPRAAWASVAAADPEALAPQGPAWMDALVASGYRDATRCYELPDGARFVLPLAARRGVAASLPAAWGMGGLIGDREPTAADVRQVVADLRTLPALRVAIRPNPLQAAAWSGTGLALPRRAHVLDLEGGAQRVFEERFTSAARRDVRRAERSGLEVVCDAGPAAQHAYHSLFERSVRRWAERQHEPHALAWLRARRRDPPAKLAAWASALGDDLRLYLAYRDGAPVAGIVVLHGRGASYTRGAMDRDLINNGDNELLQWYAIQAACAAGCRTYHMGESGSASGLSRYKEKFGARPVDYAEHRFERLPLTRLDAAARTAVKRTIGFRDA